MAVTTLALPADLARRPARARTATTHFGQPRRSRHSRKAAARGRDPWLLATSLDLPPRRIAALYATRMQIEQSFRDLKSTRYGAAFELSLTRRPERLAVLLLLLALATFVAWLTGLACVARHLEAHCVPQPTRQRRYSVVRIGCEALRRPGLPDPLAIPLPQPPPIPGPARDYLWGYLRDRPLQALATGEGIPRNGLNCAGLSTPVEPLARSESQKSLARGLQSSSTRGGDCPRRGLSPLRHSPVVRHASSGLSLCRRAKTTVAPSVVSLASRTEEGATEVGSPPGTRPMDRRCRLNDDLGRSEFGFPNGGRGHGSREPAGHEANGSAMQAER